MADIKVGIAELYIKVDGKDLAVKIVINLKGTRIAGLNVLVGIVGAISNNIAAASVT